MSHTRYLPSDLLFNDYGPTLCLHFYSIECNQVVCSGLADCLFFCMYKRILTRITIFPMMKALVGSSRPLRELMSHSALRFPRLYCRVFYLLNTRNVQPTTPHLFIFFSSWRRQTSTRSPSSEKTLSIVAFISPPTSHALSSTLSRPPPMSSSQIRT